MTELTLKKNDTPTIFNKEMAIGFLGASLFTVLLPTIGGALLLLGASTLIGGLLGKGRMENEKSDGKTVSDKPPFWNKSTIIGGLIGLKAAGLVGVATGLIGVGAGVAVATVAPPVGAGLAILGLVAAAASMIISPILGAYIGNKHGRDEERKEFAEALVQQPQVFRQPGYAMDMNPAFAAEIERQKALAALQDKAR
jgi:MFS family permease